MRLTLADNAVYKPLSGICIKNNTFAPKINDLWKITSTD
ncbi:hypothetical protein Barb6_01389 [Bacteroidales bacterium Barb6]|nr:hypothetical protein Barb6_01389 [Bacteroidales bacterium Barb6]OAV74803.1 hypothetical protein Barb7_01645 [Bacteroidales bacterium Barb7]